MRILTFVSGRWSCHLITMSKECELGGTQYRVRRDSREECFDGPEDGRIILKMK